MYLKPSFFIIGERKCGTSSLYRYLVEHPNVLPCQLKEPNFFAQGKDQVTANIEAYWKLFPTQKDQGDISFVWPELNKEGILYHEDVNVNRIQGRQYLTGEASANTFYEADPALVAEYLPDIKLILLFRNPVERAFSHHRMYQRFQEEGRELGFIVTDFESDVRQEMNLINDGGWGEFLTPGIYLRKLENWRAHFPKHQLKIFTAKELKQSPQQTLNEIMDYLDLPNYQYGDFLNHHFNKAPQASMSAELYQDLDTFFQPYNEKLESFLGRKMSW